MPAVRIANSIAWILLLALGATGSLTARAQELNPRAYWPAPVGTTVVAAGFQHSQGAFLFDPSLQIEGANSNFDAVQAAVYHTFSLFGRSANAQLAVPISWGTTDGFLAGEYRRRDMSGLTDLRARVSINLSGAPAMNREEFRQLLANPRTIVGASLAVSVPTGSYDEDRLLNIGTNRWGFKPAVGVIQPLGKGWLLEMEIGGWFFTVNDSFLGTTRAQAPLFSSELHIVKLLGNRLWLAFDANFYTGGRSKVGGALAFDLQRNSRMGATATYALGAQRRHAVRASFGTGVLTTRGGDFDSIGLAYLYVLR